MNGAIRSIVGQATYRSIAALILAALFAPALVHEPAQADELHAREVTPQKGAAPLGVVLTGPVGFVVQAHDFIAKHGACTVADGRSADIFAIDWGDAPEQASGWLSKPTPNCRMTHEYSAPGTYKIRAGFFRPGPADTPVANWLGEGTIIVTAP